MAFKATFLEGPSGQYRFLAPKLSRDMVYGASNFKTLGTLTLWAHRMQAVLALGPVESI